MLEGREKLETSINVNIRSVSFLSVSDDGFHSFYLSVDLSAVMSGPSGLVLVISASRCT